MHECELISARSQSLQESRNSGATTLQLANRVLDSSHEPYGMFFNDPGDLNETLSLPDNVTRVVEEISSPGYFGDELFQIYGPQEVVSSEDSTMLMGMNDLEGEVLTSHRVEDMFGSDLRLFRYTSAFQFLFMREVGWINPEDLIWLSTDHLKVSHPSMYECCTFYTHDDPALCRSYLSRRFDGTVPFDERFKFLNHFDVDYADESLQFLLRLNVLIEIPFKALKEKHKGEGCFKCLPQYSCPDLPLGSGIELSSPFPPLISADEDMRVKIVGVF